MMRPIASCLAAVAVVALTGSAAPVTQQTGVLWVSVLLETSDFDVKLVSNFTLTARAVGGTDLQRLVTGREGDAEIALAPGRYVLESERPFEFRGSAYRWKQDVTVLPGETTRVQLSQANAEVVSARQGNEPAAALRAAFETWQASVVTVWTETGRGSGFVIDRRGLVATAQRVVGGTEYAAVQLSQGVKVRALVVARSASSNVAILRVHPDRVAEVRPMTLGYAQDGKPPLAEAQPILAIGNPVDQRRRMTTGLVRRIEARTLVSGVIINQVNSGGPVLTADGTVVGIASFGDRALDAEAEASHVVRIDEARSLAATAEQSLTGEPPPATLLPVEPGGSFPVDAIEARLSREPVNPADYQLRSEDFDVTFITPVLTYGMQYAAQRTDEQAKEARAKPGSVPAPIDPFVEFRGWADYVGGQRAVLIVDARPRLAEDLGWKLFRGFQRVQSGQSLPAQMRFKARFQRMQLFCGEREVLPIHPGKVAHRVSMSSSSAVADDATVEGFYVYRPDEIGPQCLTVRLSLFTTKAPDTADIQVVPPPLVQRVWDDFAPYRNALLPEP